MATESVANISNGPTHPHVDTRECISDSLEEESSDHHHQFAFSAYAGPSEETIFSWI